MLSALTWNLDGLESRHRDVRMEAAALAVLLRRRPPDILLFQEVVERAWVAHLLPHLSHAGYTAARQPPTGEICCAIFVRAPLVVSSANFLAFPNSLMGRGLLEVEVAHGHQTVLVQTAHLDSGPELGAVRTAQVRSLGERLAAYPGPAIFAGDTNLRDAEVPANMAGLDTWDTLGRDPRSRRTWGPRATGWSGGRWCRFDRVYCHGVRPIQLTQVGMQPLPDADGMTVSDHAALLVALDV